LTPRLRELLIAATVASIIVGGVVWKLYGGASLWPGLVTGFGGSLLAFMLALNWERERDSVRQAKATAELAEQRITEARRRFESIRAELKKNADSLDSLRGLNESLPGLFTINNPQRLEGAWTASAPRLAELIANYELVADLATVYGRLEELRWRLRYRTEHQTPVLDGMTAPLVKELRGEVADLLERIEQQLAEPSVQPLGLLHVGRLSGSVTERSKTHEISEFDGRLPASSRTRGSARQLCASARQSRAVFSGFRR
jgi:hypothetical protein